MGSCFGLVRPHQRGIAVRQKIGLKAPCSLPFTAEAGGKHPLKRQLGKHSFTRQLHTTHAETAAHGCHFPGDMAVRMRKVLARPWVGVGVCHLLLMFLDDWCVSLIFSRNKAGIMTLV